MSDWKKQLKADPLPWLLEVDKAVKPAEAKKTTKTMENVKPPQTE